MLAIDWGTSSFRAYRLDASGRVVESRSSPRGILSVQEGRFPEVLEAEAGDWIKAGEQPIVMSGMIGSRQGWAEAPYAECPAGFEEIAAGLKEVRWNSQHAWIAPGLTCKDESGVRDVMRGEEVQILGTLDELGSGEHWLCLPGTHSKWVRVRNRRIEHFSTYMTGEVFGVLKAHSILGRMMRGDDPDMEAFAEGIERSAQPRGLLHHLFGVRARALFGELPEKSSASYLSGILIGHELRSIRHEATVVHLLCTAQLAKLYEEAAGRIGIETKVLDPDAAVKALYRIGKLLMDR